MSQRSARPLLVLIGLVALTALAVTFVKLSAPDDAPSAVEGAAPVAQDAPTSAELAAADAAAPSVAESSRAEVTAPESEEDAPARPQLAEEDTVWVEGRVLLAPETPADERLLVLSLDEPLRYPRLYYEDGPARFAWEERGAGRDLLAQAEVDAQGRFRVACSRRLGRAHLALSGRYTYSRASQAVAFDAEDAVLSGALGGWIQGSVHGVAGGGALADAVLAIGPDVTANFSTYELGSRATQMQTSSDGVGAFEFRALSPDVVWGMLARHDDYAAQLRTGLAPGPGERVRVDLELRHGATLAGRVVDASGAGFAGAEVRARLSGPIGDGMGALSTATTDVAGAFRLNDVMPGKLELRCRPANRPEVRQKLSGEVREGELREGLLLQVDEGKRIAGTVLYPDGAPGAGIEVYVGVDLAKIAGQGMGMGMPRNLDGDGSAETDAYGAFEVLGLGDGPYVVSARQKNEDGEHLGTWRARSADVAGGTQGLVLSLEGVSSVRGRVVDATGAAVERFRVAAELKGSGGMFGVGAQQRQQGFEDRAAGDFEVEELAAGTWELRVFAPGFTPSPSLEVEVPQQAEPELVVALQPASIVRGTVLDPLGRPAPGASVQPVLDLGARIATARRGGGVEAISDHAGAFELEGLDAGEAQLTASLSGYAASAPVPVELVPGETVADVVLQLRHGGALRGEVLGDDGEGAAGRSIIVQITPTYDRQHIGTSDADGGFFFEHLEPGTWQVIAMPNVLTGEIEAGGGDDMGELLGSMEMESAQIADGEETFVTLGKPPEDPLRVSGHVRHAGEPVKGAVVSFIPEEVEGLGDLKMAVTDAEGAYQIELEKRGVMLVTVQNALATGRQNSIEYRERMPAEGEQHTLDLALPLGRISGRVEGPDGRPAAGCRVTLNVEGGVAYGSVMGGHYAELLTDDAGEYDIPYLRPGDYSLSAGGALMGGLLGMDEAATGRVVRSGLHVGEDEWLSRVDFRLAKPGVLVGHVRDGAGQPVEGASVWVRDEEGRVLERFALVNSDAAGSFTYRGLGPGRYTLFAKKDGEVSSASAPVTLPEGGRAEAEAVLAPGTTLLVSVVDDSDELVHARISVTDDEGHEMSGLYSLSEIMERFNGGASGQEHRVGPLPPGKYRITATLDDGRDTYKILNLSGQDERKVRLRVR
ncbi:MAG: carboxypeptidase regulatory-like domain-containing protein [Planctomycetes bacterium]|nr:carboxypeptidase regulatory-like domain-containing protein [Planctomycetota bacterium]